MTNLLFDYLQFQHSTESAAYLSPEDLRNSTRANYTVALLSCISHISLAVIEEFIKI